MLEKVFHLKEHGTVIAVAEKAELLDEDGKLPRAGRVLMADALGTTVGAFLAIIFMPMTYSIANGIMFGVIGWVIVKLFTKKGRDISPVMWVIFALFVVRIITVVGNFR